MYTTESGSSGPVSAQLPDKAEQPSYVIIVEIIAT